MKQQIIYSLTAFILCFIALDTAAGQREDALYSKALKATFPSDKSVFTRQLARLGTKDAKAKLIRLLNHDHYWNGQAAVEGLILLKTHDVGTILLKKMFSDHMIDDNIEKAFKKHINSYIGVMIDYYKKGPEEKERHKILKLISSSKVPRGEGFFKSIINDQTSEDRKIAFKYLSENYPRNNYTYFKTFLNEPGFRLHALSFFMKHGTAKDLKMFNDIINNKEKTSYRLVAYSAVEKWGSPSRKKEVYVEALKEKDEALVQGSIYIFKNVKSKAIMNELSRQIKKSPSQNTRMPAALQLTNYNSKEVIPALVLALDENFIPKRRSGFDIFVGAITLGIASVLDHFHQKHRRSSFASNKYKIANHLKELSGVDHGTSYRKWFNWAILNGYTINGTNIIQFLFSGYPQIREKAVESSIKLLGYTSSREFFSRHEKFSDDISLSLKLTEMLIKKGFMKNEE